MISYDFTDFILWFLIPLFLGLCWIGIPRCGKSVCTKLLIACSEEKRKNGNGDQGHTISFEGTFTRT